MEIADSEDLILSLNRDRVGRRLQVVPRSGFSKVVRFLVDVAVDVREA